jgi:hypothetical protein
MWPRVTKYLFIPGAMKSKFLSTNMVSIYMEALVQKHLSPVESGTE